MLQNHTMEMSDIYMLYIKLLHFHSTQPNFVLINLIRTLHISSRQQQSPYTMYKSRSCEEKMCYIVFSINVGFFGTYIITKRRVTILRTCLCFYCFFYVSYFIKCSICIDFVFVFVFFLAVAVLKCW